MFRVSVLSVSRQWRFNLAMLIAGLASFSLMYCPQPLLPVLSSHFDIGATTASLAISLTTGPMALAILIAGVLSDRVDRPRLMAASLFLAATLTAAAALASSWPLLLILRVLTGIALAGVPAVAMAHIADETDGASLGSAMGIYVAGTAFGGMTGRLGASLASDLLNWHWAIGLIGLTSMALAVVFALLLPRSEKPRSHRAATSVREVFAGFGRVLKDRLMVLLYLEAFLFMGVFVCLYNYAGFRLIEPPFSLTQLAIGLIFLLYLLGGVSSATFGWLSGRFGRGPMMATALALQLVGVIITLSASLPLFVMGVAVSTLGFFGAHSTASGWVGARGVNRGGKGAALYLFFYYLGSAVLSVGGGMAWDRGGWTNVVVYTAVLSLLSLVVVPFLIRAAKS